MRKLLDCLCCPCSYLLLTKGFFGLQARDFSWNRRLAKYVKAEQYKKTLELFQQMQKEGMIHVTFTFVPILNPDPVTIVGVLKACAGGVLAFEEGKCAHQHIIHSGCEFDVYARRVFNKMAIRDMVSWTAMIFGHSIQTHYEYDVFVGNNLVDMYAKCGSMADAWRLFSKMHSHNENSTNQVLELDLRNSAGCAMLSNIYGLAGKWDLSANVQWQRLQWGVKKQIKSHLD
ncbi:unnamed protein product [Sphagnum troendelagicum]